MAATRRFDLLSPAAIIVLAVILMLALAGSQIYMTRASDDSVATREETVTRNGLAGWILEVEGRLVGQTTWDDAVEHLGRRFDRVWADDNIGQFLYRSAKLERAFVLDGEDRPVYASNLGEQVSLKTYADMADVAAPLVQIVRRAESERKLKDTGKPWDDVPAPIQATAVGLVAGKPNIVTVSLVQSDFGRVRLAGRYPLVVSSEMIDAQFLQSFGQRFLLNDLRLYVGRSGNSDRGRAGIDLRDRRGVVVGWLEWTPQAPARALLLSNLPVMILAIIAACLVVLFLYRRATLAIRALIASENQSKHMAYHDHLTGLPNRAMFSDRIVQALAEARRSGRALGVMTLDLDRFKLVNDTYGHGAGDELITEIALRLRRLVGDSHIVVRLGGDEFAILCAEATSDSLQTLARRILVDISESVDLSLGRIFTGVSIGITLVNDPQMDGTEALRQADLALYCAKDAGRGRFHFFEPEMDLAMKHRRALEVDLREAMRTDALGMVYQPQIDGQQRVAGLEALVRWTHPQHGPIAPAFFVAVAEESGLIEALGEFTLRRAFTDSLRWPQLKVAVNISAIQLRNAAFANLVSQILQETGADPRRIELELTEGILLENDEATHRTLLKLRALGISLALDDFGTGYSSLAYLRRYPIDKIKIDRSFITSLGVENESEAVVGAIVRLARALRLEVIAEGVETEIQRIALRRVGCSHIQGFLYSPGIPAGDVDAYIKATERQDSRRLAS